MAVSKRSQTVPCATLLLHYTFKLFFSPFFSFHFKRCFKIFPLQSFHYATPINLPSSISLSAFGYLNDTKHHLQSPWNGTEPSLKATEASSNRAIYDIYREDGVANGFHRTTANSNIYIWRWWYWCGSRFHSQRPIVYDCDMSPRTCASIGFRHKAL